MSRMEMVAAVVTDRGAIKKINQDAVFLEVDELEGFGQTALAVLCDGMGGLSVGEVASSAFVRRMAAWYREELPDLLLSGSETAQLTGANTGSAMVFDRIKSSWRVMVSDMNRRIAQYGNERGLRLGTTVVALLLLEKDWICMHVGDSRCYTFTDTMQQVTHDHSVVQQQMDRLQLTEAEARMSDQRSMLLQCIGASELVEPDFCTGTMPSFMSFLLCSDGVWRLSSKLQLYSFLSPYLDYTDEGLQKKIEEHFRDLMDRGETDNLSMVVLRCNDSR